MACTVNSVFLENGEESQLFNDLVSNMPEARALKTYLEIKSDEDTFKVLYGTNEQGEVNSAEFLNTPKFKLAEFETYRQQVDTMDYLSSALMETLRNMRSTKSPTTISRINLANIVNDPSVLPMAIKDTRQRLMDEMLAGKANGTLTQKQVDLRRQAIINMPSYIQMPNPSGKGAILGILGERLADFGVHIRVLDTQTELDDVEEFDLEDDTNNELTQEDKEITKERIYDMDILQADVSNSILDEVRIYLKTLPKVAETYKYKPSGEIEYQKSTLGHVSPMSPLVISKLFSVLEGMQSPKELIQRLEKAVKGSPELLPIYNDLKTEEASPVTVMLEDKATTYKPIATALYSTFAKKDYNMFTIAEDGGNIIFYKSNSSSVRQSLKTRWAPNIQEIRKGSPERRIALKKAALKIVNDPGLVALDSGRMNSATLAVIAKVFAQAGYDNVKGEDIRNLVDHVQSNYVKFSKSVGRKPSDIIKFFINTLVVKVADNQDVYAPSKKAGKPVDKDASKEDQYGEARNLNALSTVVGNRVTDISMNSFYSGRGTMVHPLNLSSEGQEFWDRVQTEETRELFEKDPIYAGNSILSALNDPEHAIMFDVTTMDVLNDNSKPASGVTYGNLSTFDAIASKMNGFFAGHQNKRYFYAFSPTQGDRGKTQAIITPKLDVSKSGSPDPLYIGGKLQEGEIKDWIENQVRSELTRIVQSKADKVKYKNYHGSNAVRFNLFTELNEALKLETLNATNIELFVANAMQLMDGPDGIFRRALNSDIDYLKNNNIIVDNGTDYSHTKQAKKVLSSEVGTRGKITKAEMDNFLANNLISTYDQTLLYLGDMAYYSSKGEFEQKADLNKRFSLPFTPGNKIAVGAGHGIKERSNIKILNEPKVDSELADFYNALGDTDLYKDIELGDGGGYVSLERYRSLLLAEGSHNEALLAYLGKEIAWTGGPPPDSKGISLEVKKGFYFRLQEGEHGRVAPMNLKYSIMPVIPSYFEQKVNGEYKYPGLAKISIELRSKELGSADEVVMASAVKVGGINHTSLEDLGKAKATAIYNDSYRLLNVNPSKKKIEDRFGSQMRTIITGNFNTTGVLDVAGETVESSKALKRYEEALKRTTSSAGDSVYREFVKNGEISVPSLVRKVLKAVSISSKDNADYYKEALSEREDGSRLLPTQYPTLSSKIDSLINAAFRSKVNRQKLPGHSAVQVSSFGTRNVIEKVTKKNIAIGSDLKFVSIEGVDNEKAADIAKAFRSGDTKAFDGYKIAPAEVRITPKFFRGTIRKEAEDKIDKKAIAEKVAKFANGDFDKMLSKSEKERAIQIYKTNLTNDAIIAKEEELMRLVTTNGKFDIRKIREAGLDNLVLYRIPTQGKNSMTPAVITEFLPEGMGASIQIPAEMVTQSGSDFDIDKLFIEMSAFHVRDGKLDKVTPYNEKGELDLSSEEKAKAYITEFHRAVLLSPDYISDLLAPNGAPTLKELAKTIGQNDTAMSSSFASLATQEMFRSNNKAGGAIISISSIASVAHAVAQRIMPEFIQKVTIADTELKLGNEYNNDDTAKISKEIEEIQSASLDNAKDPLLGKLNINEFTASTVLLLVSGGYGLKFATTVVNSPIVKDLSAVYPMYERKFTRDRALYEALRDVTKRYKLSKSLKEANSVYKSGKYLPATAEVALTNLSPEYQAAALKAFLEFKGYGDALQKFQIAMNFGSKGTSSSVAGLFKQYTALMSIPGTLTHSKEYGESTEVTTAEGEDEVVYKTPQHLKGVVVTESKKITLKEDGSKYVYEDGGKKVELKRMSDYLKEQRHEKAITYDEAKSKAATTAGSYIDKQVRSFFLSGSIDGTNMTQEAYDGLLSKLTQLKAHFDSRGESVITSPNYLKVYDLRLGVAGEMDFLTVDKAGKVRIYDTKTRKFANAAEYQKEYPKWSKEKAEDAVNSRARKWHEQLNGYRGVLRNMTGVKAVELNVFPLDISYTEDGTQITEVREGAGLLESYSVIKDFIPDTRKMSSIHGEMLQDKMGFNPKKAVIRVNRQAYMDSHLSQMEKNTIHDPLKVNRLISPAASVQFQRVLNAVTEAVGWLNESQQIGVFTEYSTYLALNSKASTKYKTSLSRRLATAEHLSLTDRVSPKSLSAQIANYRAECRMRTIPENPFVAALNTIDVNNRLFVGLDNTVAKSLTAESKKEMMFFFEDLMDAGENTTEEKLARALADYAMIHYGFSRGFNSYMEFLPPRAHQKYMGSVSGKTAKTLPEFFSEVYENLDSVENFRNPAEDFVTLYVQNNAHKLPLERIPKYIGGEENVNWLQDLVERSPEGEPLPKFLLLENNSDRGYELLRLDESGNTYSPIQFRGIPGFAVEYNDMEDSIFNSQIGSTSGKVKKTELSTENREVISNWQQGLNNVDKFFTDLGDFTNLQTVEEAESYVNRMKDSVAKSEATPAEKDLIYNTVDGFLTSSINEYKRAVKRGRVVTFASIMHKALVDLRDITFKSTKTLAQIVKYNC